MNMKYVVISGASGGMGLTTVKKFAGNGYYVFALDIKEPSENVDNVCFIETNLRDYKSIESAVKEISKVTPEIDLIINMAGIYDLNSLIEMSEEDFIRIFDINVFAAYRLNKALTPLLKDGGKIIITSSELAPLDPLPFTGIYAITKTTVEAYAYSLRMELQLLNKQVIIIRPGAVNTSLLDVSTTKIERFSKESKIYSYNANNFKKVTEKVESRKIPPEKIADLAYKIANKKKPKYIYKINRNPLLLLLDVLPQRTQNWIIKKILQQKSK